MTTDLTRLLATDPLADAERLTGQSYKDDPATLALGFLMHTEHVKKKGDALAAAGDSHRRMNLADTLTLYAAMGFEEHLCDTFDSDPWPDEPVVEETYRVLWHNGKGLLAVVESYSGTRTNTSKVYYNVRFNEGIKDRWARTSSGSFHDDVWCGDHDAREGIRHNLSRLEEVGEFLPVWRAQPFLWLLTYQDSKVDGYDFRAITDERISRLPKHVQTAIAGDTA